ncbi:hypothetical protein CANCADRAFT_287 [Tortispora caseinolytica NRRL Y-17796]|uniref:Coatomer subunit delta n=1 Tax=Tortispora caseinolytica NRRL Y-17796 TaxID=767744 RepID=A0A1E4TIY9_9ASCO|nr:hypothetical protein CANCADRAFT_287 [Tortispora caseinolytica NRRL Y-17796]
MAVLAASIFTKTGKPVISRQFKEISRGSVDSLLSAFTKLWTGGTQSGSQHTLIEDGNSRYLYQPTGDVYVVLVTSKSSNIMQDISSLRLFSQVVTQTCRNCTEQEVLDNAFELFAAFDEIIALGYRENVTLNQVRTFLAMESHEEKIHEIIARNKELEASEERKRRAKQLEIQRRELAKQKAMTARTSMASMSHHQPQYIPVRGPEVETTSGGTDFDEFDSHSQLLSGQSSFSGRPTGGSGKKGMSLGSKKTRAL